MRFLTVAGLLLQTPLNVQDYPVKLCANVPEGNSYSCSLDLVSSNSCCYEDYGVIMQTQFWDYNPKYVGKAALSSSEPNVFTIHGLWDDLCDGSYLQNCRPDEAFTLDDDVLDIIVNDFGRQDLYDTMQKYWVNNAKLNVPGGSLPELWTHEFNKHGTCFNTIQPLCFEGPYKRFENAIAFYQKVIEVWQTLPTYTFLAQAGIKPSSSKQYALSDVQAALKKAHGHEVYVGCRSGAIDEIWYYHNVKGNILNGQYKAIDSLTKSNCPSKVWYYPKT